MSKVLVAGAGMAGLVAAARLRELDVPVEVREKGDRPGGAMILSSGVVWRHRGLEEFRRECPGGDPTLQRLIVERLDELLDWLEALGARVVARETGNPRTVGRRFDPHRLTETLVRAAGAVHLSSPVTALPAGLTILATGGFAVSLARELALPLRASPWAEGDGIRLARERGAALSSGLDEFYGRALPAPPARISDADFVRAAQLYGHLAHVVDDAGIPFFGREPHWSETDLVQALARRPGGRGWYVLDRDGLEQSLRDCSVTEMVAAAEELGGEVRRSHSVPELGLGGLLSPKLATPPFTAVHVVASVTHTLGGLVIDEEARVLGPGGIPVPQLYACGVDAGGIATGGYASGLAAGLVLGVGAAESIVGLQPPR